MNLVQKDHDVIWHPYTHQKDRSPSIAITKAKDSILIDENGNKYIDGISSWWVTVHGHSNPYIAKKIYEQAKIIEHIIFAGFTHRPAVEFAKRILPLLPGKFDKVFYSDNGSTAVEVAIKMSLQYWLNKDVVNRTKIIAFNNSYHGDTFGAMSASARSVFTKAFDDKLFEVIFIDTPNENNIHELKNLIDTYALQTACFIYEPLIQGAGGMLMYDTKWLNELLYHFKTHNIICIADEVMTGFFRTGKMFASLYCETKPDIICLSKGITGGTMAMGLTACTLDIFEAFVSDDKLKTFYHGHSFTANPLSCAAALASLDLTEKKSFSISINNIVNQIEDFLKILKKKKYITRIKNIRQCGTIAAFEIISNEADNYLNKVMQKFTPFCLSKGVYLRSLGNTIYIMPPYCIKRKELKKIFATILAFLEEPSIPI